MSMKVSIMVHSCKLTLLFLFISFSANSAENESEVSYSDYCSSVVPESVPNSETYNDSFGAFDGYDTGYYIGGNGILDPKITGISNRFWFETGYASRTVADGVWKIKGILTFYGSYDPQVLPSPFHLNLHGFWSEFSGNLCMVGTGYGYCKQGTLLTPSVVFKLRNLRNSSNITTLITGTLDSLSDGVSYFESISMIMFPSLNYKYTFNSGEFEDEFSAESDALMNLPSNELPSRSFCSMMLGNVNEFELQYTSDCTSGKQNCLPVFWLNGYSPRFLSLLSIQCSEVERRIRVLVEFRNSTSHVGTYPSFNPYTTLIGEGTWDNEKNQLFIFVCRILDIGESWSNAHVGDCTTRLSFMFPAVLSIRETSSTRGRIWTTKTANDSSYFDRISFRSTGNRVQGVPGLKYEYTEFNRVKNLCLRNMQPVINKGQRYPSGHSTDMKFDMLVMSSEKKHGWGSANPLAIDDRLYKPLLYPMDLPSERIVPSRLINVSYEVSITLQTPREDDNGVHFAYIEQKLEITAEGVYDSETGKLCMVGCRKLGSENQVLDNAFMDCGVLLNFRFAPLEPNQNEGYIAGSIESTRKSSDVLYFRRLDVSSATYKTDRRKSSIWTMDVETTKVLLTNTLMCIFVGLQLYHVKKNPKVLPSISLVMLVILNLGHMVPLVLDRNKVLPHNGGLIDLNEVIVKTVTVVAFLLLYRLLQLTVSARSHDTDRKTLWFAEEKTLLVIAFLYAAVAKFMLLVAWENRRLQSSVEYRQHSICNYLKSYAGSILDSFLLPQILVNMFSNSRRKALSCSFFIGITFIRLLPHAYDLHCNLSNVYYNILQVSVNDDHCFVSAAWDVTMFWGLLVLAAIIFVQQKNGAHCILPSRHRQLDLNPEEVKFYN
ncbi:Ubiquitin-conjugating enzyme 25, putative isoform 1 [Hibiscus syriacus]|uniref:RING-type E3 ubiquitin transferase n=1 Tax=Hibiscus syriacus TaxID=106335 RepID=A0A6A2XDR4_HIBSY|nr:Ubiquitin-conjugating enzyme 25, putative isoform 1 [Hibiscus syriacus]